jgi:antitoxin VapB
MSPKIKDEDTHRLVRELAQLTGESQTTAVAVAIRERLDRLHAVGRRSLADRLVAIGKDTAPRLKEPYRSEEHGDLLFARRAPAPGSNRGAGDAYDHAEGGGADDTAVSGG